MAFTDLSKVSDDLLLEMSNFKSFCLSGKYECVLFNDNISNPSEEQLEFFLKEKKFSELSPDAQQAFKEMANSCNCCAAGVCGGSLLGACEMCSRDFYSSNDYILVYDGKGKCVYDNHYYLIKTEVDARGLNKAEETDYSFFNISFLPIIDGISLISEILLFGFLAFLLSKKILTFLNGR